MQFKYCGVQIRSSLVVRAQWFLWYWKRRWNSVVLSTWRYSSPKNKNLLKIYLPSSHPKCTWVCFFIRTNLEKCSITILPQWFLCSEWVPSQLIKTWHHDSSPSINILRNNPSFLLSLNKKFTEVKNTVYGNQWELAWQYWFKGDLQHCTFFQSVSLFHKNLEMVAIYPRCGDR